MHLAEEDPRRVIAMARHYVVTRRVPDGWHHGKASQDGVHMSIAVVTCTTAQSNILSNITRLSLRAGDASKGAALVAAVNPVHSHGARMQGGYMYSHLA